jgi:type IV pilus assembly protein PilV
MTTARLQRLRSAQGGVMLLEALIGLLIFSVGVLSLVAMQSVSISNVSNARYRVEAAFAAEELLNHMWFDSGVQLANLDNYRWPGGNSPYLMNWIAKLQTGNTAAPPLPGAFTYPPTVVVVPSAYNYGPSNTLVNVKQVIVTIRWKAPDALAPSNHQAIAWITEQ